MRAAHYRRDRSDALWMNVRPRFRRNRSTLRSNISADAPYERQIEPGMAS
jgi:hypothetical protein